MNCHHYQDPIILKLLSTRQPQQDVSEADELERQNRMYNMLRFSSKYRRMQVENANSTWGQQIDLATAPQADELASQDSHDKVSYLDVGRCIQGDHRASEETHFHSNESHLDKDSQYPLNNQTSPPTQPKTLSKERDSGKASIESICTCDSPCTRYLLINKCINQSIDTDLTFSPHDFYSSAYTDAETDRNSRFNSLSRTNPHNLNASTHEEITSGVGVHQGTQQNLFSTHHDLLTEDSYNALEVMMSEERRKVRFQQGVSYIPEVLHPETRKAVLRGFLECFKAKFL